MKRNLIASLLFACAVILAVAAEVDKEKPPPSGEIKDPIISMVMASAIDDKGKLVNPRFTFPPNEPQITAIVYVGKTNGAQLKVTWYKVSEDEDGKPFDEKLFEHQIQVKSNERAFSVAKNPGGTLELGRYKVVATLEGQTKETKFDISPPRQPSKTSNRPQDELLEGQIQSTDTDRAFSLGTNSGGLRTASGFHWAGGSGTRTQKVAWSVSSLGTGSNAITSQGAQQGKRPVAGTSGTAPQSENAPTGASTSDCKVEVYSPEGDIDTGRDTVNVVTRAQCTGVVQNSYAVYAKRIPYNERRIGGFESGSYVYFDVDPCGQSGGSDLPGSKIEVQVRSPYSDNLLASAVITLGDDTSAPEIPDSDFRADPERGSFVKENDKIHFYVFTWDVGDSWQTGIRRIWFKAQPEGSFDKDEWTNPSRLPKPCTDKMWRQDFKTNYTVPKNPPPIVEICAYADDYADNENSKCADFATGQWRGTLREHAQGNLYNETVTVIFSFNEERDGTIKGAGRVKVISEPQTFNDCKVTRKPIRPEPLLFPISGKRVGDEFHLELPTDYRLRLHVKTDCPPPKTSGTVTATRSLGLSEVFYHPKVKAQDGATNSFHKPGAMEVDGSIEIHRTKQ